VEAGSSTSLELMLTLLCFFFIFSSADINLDKAIDHS